MKKFLLQALMIPSVALGIPIQLNGPDSDFTAFTSEGYRVEHSRAFDRSTGFNRWWVSFFSEPGVAFDARSFSGDLPPGLSQILVQGETPSGEYYSRIFRLKPHLSAESPTTLNLDERFRNLSWLRVAGIGLDNDFALRDVALTSSDSVPETGPGILLMASVFAAVAFLGCHASPAAGLSPQRHRSRNAFLRRGRGKL